VLFAPHKKPTAYPLFLDQTDPLADSSPVVLDFLMYCCQVVCILVAADSSGDIARILDYMVDKGCY
jgi:hypothetical protein